MQFKIFRSNSATQVSRLFGSRVKRKEIVWCSANSFVSTANCAVFCGATIDFVDINLDDYNIDVTLELKLKIKHRFRPKILIVTHIGGYSLI